MRESKQIQEITISQIRITENHRTNVNDTKIHELMQSIKQHGLEQPVGLSRVKKNEYHLIFGQRRFLACQKLGWKTISAIVSDKVSSQDMSILGLTENIQRYNPSFAEIGRGIEKLQKDGLTLEEVSVRLGISLNKIKSILGTYTKLPEKHRKKVSFMGRGKRKNGTIPPIIANKVIALKQRYGLPDKACDELIKYVIDTDMSKEDLTNLGILLGAGLKVEDAIEHLHSYHVFHVDIVVDRTEAGRRMQEHGLPNAKALFRKIVYGEIKPVKKPDFIKY